MGQKKRIGFLYNKPIIDGDINLKTTNEIHKSELYNSREEESSRESEFYYFDLGKLKEFDESYANMIENHYSLYAFQYDESNGPMGVRQRAYFNRTYPIGSGFPGLINEYIQVPKRSNFQAFNLPLFEVLVFEAAPDFMEVLLNPELMEEGKKELETILTPYMVTEEVFYNGKKPDFNDLRELAGGTQ